MKRCRLFYVTGIWIFDHLRCVTPLYVLFIIHQFTLPTFNACSSVWFIKNFLIKYGVRHPSDVQTPVTPFSNSLPGLPAQL
jgi:hypothetical protein